MTIPPATSIATKTPLRRFFPDGSPLPQTMVHRRWGVVRREAAGGQVQGARRGWRLSVSCLPRPARDRHKSQPALIFRNSDDASAWSIIWSAGIDCQASSWQNSSFLGDCHNW